MKLCTLSGTALRLHPLFPLLLLLFLLGGQGTMIAAYLLALLLHEAGHYYAARRMGLAVSEIELTPFGGAMQISLSDGLTGRKGFFLAAAGITVNAICAAAGVLLLQGRHSPFFIWFTTAHLTMLLFNLLPVLPLDGGRMLLALLSVRFRREKVFRVLLALGRALAAALMLYSLLGAVFGRFRPVFILLSCYLLYAAALEEKHGAAWYLSALFSRRLKIENGTAVPVQHVCVHKSMTLFRLLPQLQPGAYHMVSVTDDDGCTILATVREDRLYRAILEDPAVPMGNLIPS